MPQNFKDFAPYNGIKRDQTQDPYEAVRTLLSGRGEANVANNPAAQLKGLRENRDDEITDQLTGLTRSQGGQRGSPTSGPFGDYSNNIPGMNRPDEVAPQDNRGDIGALVGLLNKNKSEMDSDPFTGTQARQANDATFQTQLNARTEGFNSPAEAAEYGRQSETYKQDAPIRAEQEKGNQERLTNRANISDIQGLLNPGGGQQPSGATNLTPPADPSGAPAAAQSLQSFFGGGDEPYNSAKDMAQAYIERKKYGIMATPYSELAQDTSFANLQQIQAMFPGVRGFSYLMPKFAEHQAQWGNETPAATYKRLHGMISMLEQTEQEFNDPRVNIKMGADGRATLANPPQTLQRAKMGLNDSKQKLQRAIQSMEQLYPGIGGSGAQAPAQAPAAPPPTGAGRFERLP